MFAVITSEPSNLTNNTVVIAMTSLSQGQFGLSVNQFPKLDLKHESKSF